MADPILLRQGHFTISVAAPANDARWIEEFFGDSYAATGNEAALTSVGLASEERPPAGDVPIGDRLAFALDSGPIRLPAYRSSAHERLVEPDTGIAYEVSNDGARVTVRYGDCPPQAQHGGQSPNRLTARVRLMRVVREYFHNSSLHAGGLVLHAAAVVHDGRAIAIAGRKGAGKTTMLLRLLRDANASFLSNDRVLVTGDLAPQAQAIPTVVSLRDGTLGLLPLLATRLSQAGDFRSHQAERRAAGPSPPVRTAEGIRLDAHQLCEALGCPMTPIAPLGAVVVIDEALPAGNPRRLKPDEAVPLLATALLGSRTGVYTSEVFLHPTHLSHLSHLAHPTHLAHPSHLAHLVPCFLITRLDPDAGAVERLLAVCAHACA